MFRFLLALCLTVTTVTAYTQNMAEKANAFIRLLNKEQQSKAIFPFDTAERYHFAYVPRDDRKGIAVKELNTAQQQALMELLSTTLSETTVRKINSIMELEKVLKDLEHRGESDHYRDPQKYYLTIFGVPATNNIWGWRFEGHHVAFNFSASKRTLVSGTPSFLGANPAVVKEGPLQGRETLKEETTKAFELLQALSPGELQQTLVSDKAPAEIITGPARKAMIAHPEGIHYDSLSPEHQQLLLALISVYIHRYTKLFADRMLKEIQEDGLENLYFMWAGSTVHAPGNSCYYRIQGPGLIIEYDNIQNNANHIHTIIRDLKNDFGGDMLLDHYRQEHQAGSH
ncbi:DUF3500 domain-containing protein [Chitinophaga sp. 212800010-3]|uniref:DUF3500 domain-containing protein n=1 Tax=unclassified Chitinophaga TaxID=2619133 RepID=UPI002DE8DC84|nr:DUF3500 domain-containing protein [Chitinophaga sp. 212800010-3]